MCEVELVITAINQMRTEEMLSNAREYFVQKRQGNAAMVWMRAGYTLMRGLMAIVTAFLLQMTKQPVT